MSEQQDEMEVPQWDVADRMAKALRESGVSATDMAEYLNVHRNTISNYLHGRSAPSRATLIAWAYCTRFPLEWLVTGQAPASPSPGNDRYPVAA